MSIHSSAQIFGNPRYMEIRRECFLGPPAGTDNKDVLTLRSKRYLQVRMYACIACFGNDGFRFAFFAVTPLSTLSFPRMRRYFPLFIEAEKRVTMVLDKSGKVIDPYTLSRILGYNTEVGIRAHLCIRNVYPNKHNAKMRMF